MLIITETIMTTEFAVDDVVRASGELGTFIVTKIYKNGDIGCWGGLGGWRGIKHTTGHAQFRAFKAYRLRKIVKK